MEGTQPIPAFLPLPIGLGGGKQAHSDCTVGVSWAGCGVHASRSCLAPCRQSHENPLCMQMPCQVPTVQSSPLVPIIVQDLEPAMGPSPLQRRGGSSGRVYHPPHTGGGGRRSGIPVSPGADSRALLSLVGRGAGVIQRHRRRAPVGAVAVATWVAETRMHGRAREEVDLDWGLGAPLCPGGIGCHTGELGPSCGPSPGHRGTVEPFCLG